MFSATDTIVAIATPAGRGGVGVVRVSGPRASEIAREILTAKDPLAPRVATFTRVIGTAPVETEGRAIDRVVATWFPGPASYTGEDVLEVSAHGSPLVLQAIVRASMNAGARLAEPGEFTLRAYLNESELRRDLHPEMRVELLLELGEVYGKDLDQATIVAALEIILDRGLPVALYQLPQVTDPPNIRRASRTRAASLNNVHPFDQLAQLAFELLALFAQRHVVVPQNIDFVRRE